MINTEVAEGSKGAKSTGTQSQGMASTNGIIPARLTDEGTKYVQELALQTFREWKCGGCSY